MEKQNEEKNTNLEDVISKSEVFIEKNQKLIIIIVVAILVVIFAIFGLRKWYFQPRQVKANEAIFAAEQWLAQDQYQLALDGNEKYAGFNEVAKQYGSTKAGKRAKYEAGICYLNLGQLDEAAKAFASYKGKDVFTKVLAVVAEGDAELDLGNNAQALKLYEKAAKMDDNEITAPYALFKAGMVYIIDGNGEKAKAHFETIKEQYPTSTEWNEIDKYIALAENL